MSAYRDEYEALRTRTERLERELEERDARIAGLEERLGDNDALVERLHPFRGDPKTKTSRRSDRHAAKRVIDMPRFG